MRARTYLPRPSGTHTSWTLAIAVLLAVAALWLAPASPLVPSALAQSAGGSFSSSLEQAVADGRDKIEAGDYRGAQRALTGVVGRADTPADLMALAFFYRAVAFRLGGQPRRAVADLGNALWLQSLPPPIAAQAHLHRALAYAALGRGPEAEADLNAAERLSPGAAEISQAREIVANSTAPLSPEAAARRALAPSFASPGAARAPAAEHVDRPSAPEPVGGLALGEGEFAVQLGALGSRRAASSEWQRLAARHSDILSRFQPVYEAVDADGRELVRLRAVPMTSLPAAEDLCRQLQARGERCIPVGR